MVGRTKGETRAAAGPTRVPLEETEESRYTLPRQLSSINFFGSLRSRQLHLWISSAGCHGLLPESCLLSFVVTKAMCYLPIIVDGAEVRYQYSASLTTDSSKLELVAGR